MCAMLGAGHFNGDCKPCAFLYTRGCENGSHCSFCHLCPPDEKRKRQKEKQAYIAAQLITIQRILSGDNAREFSQDVGHP